MAALPPQTRRFDKILSELYTIAIPRIFDWHLFVRYCLRFDLFFSSAAHTITVTAVTAGLPKENAYGSLYRLCRHLPFQPLAGDLSFFLDAESGKLTGANCVLDVPDSKYLAIRQDGLLASVVGRAGKAGLCVADLRQSSHPFQVEAFTEGSAGCHAAFYQTYGYTANFHAGTVSFYRIADKTPVFSTQYP